MPLVTPTGFDELRGSANADVDAVVPVVDGHDQPLHTLYRWDAVEGTASRVPTQAGPMALLDALPIVERVEVTDADASLASAITNVNTRARRSGESPTDSTTARPIGNLSVPD